MKPYVICHMVASIDGRTLTSRWRPEDAERRRQFEPLHDRLGVDAWLVGRITGQEYAKRDAYPHQTGQRYPREAWFAQRDAAAYGIVLDPHGRIAWGRADIGGDPVVVVLTEQVGDAHLAGLREDGVSYIFTGARNVELGLALDILHRELGIKRLEVNGGGITNGAFLRAGLVDEISLAIFPVDGSQGARFDSESHTYGYSFSRELLDEWHWGERFAPQPETERYLNHVADKFDLRRDIQFNSRVAAAHYHEETRSWDLTLEDGRRYSTRFLITAIGILSAPTMPNIPGIGSFKGNSCHTHAWPRDGVDFAGKRV